MAGRMGVEHGGCCAGVTVCCSAVPPNAGAADTAGAGARRYDTYAVCFGRNKHIGWGIPSPVE